MKKIVASILLAILWVGVCESADVRLPGPSGGGIPVGGTGTANIVAKFTGTSTVGNSTITEASGAVGIAAVANTLPLAITGYSVTGTGTTGGFSITGTLNTSGAADVISTAITCTSCAAANLINLYAGAAGATSRFKVDANGVVTTADSVRSGGDLQAAAASKILWAGRAHIFSPADGHVKIIDSNESANGMLSLGVTTLTLTAGAIGLPKMTASGTAPGATGAKLEVVCGTNAGTAKLVIYAGTSGTALDIKDNIGAGVTGC